MLQGLRRGELPMKKPRKTGRNLLRSICIALGLAAFLLYILLPFAFGVYAVLPAGAEVGPPPGGFAEISLRAADGVSLAGWYAPPANGAAIILLHGAGSNREQLRPYAAMLQRHGYGVLALDLRGHGRSGGRGNKFGWQGTLDVGAAVAYLRARPEVKALGGLGLSLGGEVLLGAASAYPEIHAIAADGATRRSLAEQLALPAERPLYRNFTARVMFAAVRLFSGTEPPKPLLDSMRAAKTTSFYFIAAGAKEREVDFNTLFAAAAEGRARLWVVPEAAHTGARRLKPDEYERRLAGFFGRVLKVVQVS